MAFYILEVDASLRRWELRKERITGRLMFGKWIAVEVCAWMFA